MARYIDLDKALERLNASPAFPNMGADGYFLLGVIEDLLKKIPTADVVPKYEYDEVLSSWKKIHDSYADDCIEHYNYGRTEVAREIFEEIERETKNHGITYAQRKIAELKKKYTEQK